MATGWETFSAKCMRLLLSNQSAWTTVHYELGSILSGNRIACLFSWNLSFPFYPQYAEVHFVTLNHLIPPNNYYQIFTFNNKKLFPHCRWLSSGKLLIHSYRKENNLQSPSSLWLWTLPSTSSYTYQSHLVVIFHVFFSHLPFPECYLSRFHDDAE